MDNAHERRWPPGLLTLETRQMNRRQYEQVNKKLLISFFVNDFCQQRQFMILIINGRLF
jgi:hypothetical protein